MHPKEVDFLILGAGWTSQFLEPLLEAEDVTYAATTTDGRNGTIPFKFDPNSEEIDPYQRLPSAKTVLITFPLQGTGQSSRLTGLYRDVHGTGHSFIQLGSTGIFTNPHWNDHNAAYDKSNSRAIAEDELRTLGGCVLNLAGLYGGERDPKNWVMRVAKTKEQVKAKLALHLIHGEDVARGLLALHRRFTPGARWLLTDLHVYDWWDLIYDWGPQVQERAKSTIGDEEARKLDYQKWVGQLLIEEAVRALPRSAESLGRTLDSRAFWKEMGVWPIRGRVT